MTSREAGRGRQLALYALLLAAAPLHAELPPPQAEGEATEALQPAMEIPPPLAAATSATVWQEPLLDSTAPRVAIIIDDLGDRYRDGLTAIRLPGALTYAILPQTTYTTRLAILAHCANKEVMLHQPMEAINGRRMGPGGINEQMAAEVMAQTLRANLASVPFARGINNHMGSLLTSKGKQMERFMEALAVQAGERSEGLYFVDSLTSSKSVARQVAREHALPTTRRNIFLDNVASPAAIERQFAKLIREAKRQGSAVAIGHPYPATLATLPRLIQQLEAEGIALVPVSELIALKEQKRSVKLWHASLSPSPKGAKSLKQ